MGRRQIFRSPLPGKLFEFSRAVEGQFAFDFFAVGLDGLGAEVKSLRNLRRAIGCADELKNLQLAIRQAFQTEVRGTWFFSQASLDYRGGDPFAEI